MKVGPGDRLDRPHRRRRRRTTRSTYRDVLATVYHNLGIDPHGMVYDVVGPAEPDPAEHGAGDWQARVSPASIRPAGQESQREAGGDDREVVDRLLDLPLPAGLLFLEQPLRPLPVPVELLVLGAEVLALRCAAQARRSRRSCKRCRGFLSRRLSAIQRNRSRVACSSAFSLLAEHVLRRAERHDGRYGHGVGRLRRLGDVPPARRPPSGSARTGRGLRVQNPSFATLKPARWAACRAAIAYREFELSARLPAGATGSSSPGDSPRSRPRLLPAISHCA